jgi:hypothetical protein
MLVAVAPLGAQEEDSATPTDSETTAPPNEGEAEAEAAEEVGLTKEERKAKRQARKARKAETAAAEGDETEGDSEGIAAVEPDSSTGDEESAETSEDAGADSEDDSENDSENGAAADEAEAEESDPDSEDDDSDSDSDHPALLVITTDAPCRVYVDRKSEGELEPGNTLEVGVDLGEIEVRAISLEVGRAAWEKTLEFEEEGQAESVRVRMSKTIRKLRQEERQTGVFKDRQTALMWMRRDNGRDVDLREAYAFCRDLDYAGYDGWRLPTLEELETLEAVWQRANYKIKGEIMLSECCMWSTDYDGTERAWTFNYRFRKAFETNAGYELGLRALCVREYDPDLEPEPKKGEEEGATETSAGEDETEGADEGEDGV